VERKLGIPVLVSIPLKEDP